MFSAPLVAQIYPHLRHFFTLPLSLLSTGFQRMNREQILKFSVQWRAVLLLHCRQHSAFHWSVSALLLVISSLVSIAFSISQQQHGDF
jgi:hypothetical protein